MFTTRVDNSIDHGILFITYVARSVFELIIGEHRNRNDALTIPIGGGRVEEAKSFTTVTWRSASQI